MAYRFSPWRIVVECASAAPCAIVAGNPDAETFVIEAVRRLLGVVGNPNLTASARADAVAAAVSRLAGVGAFGARTYDGRLWLGTVEGVTLLGSTSTGPDEAIVMFTIKDGQAFAPIQMSWSVLRSASGWRLIDVEYQGVWLVGPRGPAPGRQSRV